MPMGPNSFSEIPFQPDFLDGKGAKPPHADLLEKEINELETRIAIMGTLRSSGKDSLADSELRHAEHALAELEGQQAGERRRVIKRKRGELILGYKNFIAKEKQGQLFDGPKKDEIVH